MDTWAPGTKHVSVDELLAQSAPWLLECDGVTISGGEPLEQPNGLLALLMGIRTISDGDVLLYSGQALEAVIPQMATFEGLIDAVIADPFVAEAGQTLALRGSDNQRMLCLTPQGEARLRPWDRLLRPNDRALDVMFDDEDGSVFLAGIPRPGDMRRLTELLAIQGHTAATTEDQRDMHG